jgi:hypothetical protein
VACFGLGHGEFDGLELISRKILHLDALHLPTNTSSSFAVFYLLFQEQLREVKINGRPR